MLLSSISVENNALKNSQIRLLSSVSGYVRNCIEELYACEDMTDVADVSMQLSKLVRVLNETIFKIKN